MPSEPLLKICGAVLKEAWSLKTPAYFTTVVMSRIPERSSK